MRIITFIFGLSILLSSCGTQYGSVSGNVYWKYNNFIGNKPDAGSDIYLYAYEKNSKSLDAKADVQGNFKFEKVPTGEYLLIIVSENTRDSPDEQLRKLISSSQYLKDVFDFDLDKTLPIKLTDFKFRDSSLNKMRDDIMRSDIENHSKSGNADNLLKQMGIENKKQDTLRNVASEIIEALPVDLIVKFAYGKKIEIEKIKVEKEKSTTEVIDFGTTYM
jgi:hypothetical protein